MPPTPPSSSETSVGKKLQNWKSQIRKNSQITKLIENHKFFIPQIHHNFENNLIKLIEIGLISMILPKQIDNFAICLSLGKFRVRLQDDSFLREEDPNKVKEDVMAFVKIMMRGSKNYKSIFFLNFFKFSIITY